MPKKISDEDRRLAKVIQNIGKADKPATNSGQPSGYRNPKGPAKMTADQYQSKREWLVDTAETKAQQKALPKELAKLQADYRSQAGLAKKGGSHVFPTYKTY